VVAVVRVFVFVLGSAVEVEVDDSDEVVFA